MKKEIKQMGILKQNNGLYIIVGWNKDGKQIYKKKEVYRTRNLALQSLYRNEYYIEMNLKK